MVEDELITTRFVAFAGANDHPPAAFPNRDHGCGFPWRKRAFSSVFLLSLRERCATRRRLLK